MKKKYTIEVTRRNIIDGKKSKQFCPIDYAAWSVFGSSVEDVMTTEDEINIFDGWKMAASIPLPQTAKEFIEKFDAGEEVKPFTFEVLA